MRKLRFAVGVTLSAALAYGIDWSLSSLLPIFSCMLLALPLPKPDLQLSLRNMGSTFKAFILGLIFSLFLLNYPVLYLILLSLVIFHLYYYLNRGGSFWLTLMSLVAILVLPLLANSNEGLAMGFSIGFVYSSWLSIGILWLMHFIFPDPVSASFPKQPVFQKQYSATAARLALKSTLVTFPIACVFIGFELDDYILVMIFAAIFILKPELSAGLNAGKNSMVSTLLGGTAAWFFYWFMVAVPQYYFLLLLLLLTSLFFASNIFSVKSTAKYYSSGLIALLIIFNASMMPNSDFNSVLIMRILLISGAIAYIIMMIKVLEHIGLKGASA